MFVVSQWEDYTYRYMHVNQLSQVAKNFVSASSIIAPDTGLSLGFPGTKAGRR